jgi:sialate O-acetylesterase
MLLTSRKIALLAAVAMVCSCHAATGETAPMSSAHGPALFLPRQFSDNMVLQQGASVPIWGWGREGDAVTVEFRGQKVSTRVTNGKWLVKLLNLKAGGPDTLTITSSTTIKLKNVLVGEVWLASGQSNMEFPLKKSYEADADISASANPMIHLLKVPKARMDSPAEGIGASWTECNPGTAADFSAVEYYFARDLQKELHVPIGVIESDWGGTPADAWIQREFLQANPEYHTQVFEEWIVAQDIYERGLAAYNKKKDEAKEKGLEFTNAPPRRPWKPGELYNGMIAPLAGYAIKGVIWYQGESNAGSAEDAWLYHTLFPDLIRNWRNVWGEGAFPFLLVQLAPYRAIRPEPSESSWASVREAQLKATEALPNVGMAVITDLGDQRNIHPPRKQPVGARLALAARGIAYHQTIEYSGPVFKQAKIDKDHIVLTFDHVGGGLTTPGADEPLEGFSICGPDGKFAWATALIKGLDQVIVYSDVVDHPTAVRYGWADYPVVNLYNKTGLPASPFRTDDTDLR